MVNLSNLFSGPKWKRDRKLMAPLFLAKNWSTYFPVILKHTLILRDKLEEKIDSSTFNVYPIIHHCVADFVNGNHLKAFSTTKIVQK